MPEEEKKDVNIEETPSVPQGEEASSPEAEPQEQQDAQTPTAEQGVDSDVQEQVPFGEHPRFKELIDEKNYLKQQNEQLLKMSQTQQAPKTQEQPLGNTPEEREFWGQVKGMAKNEAQALIKQKEAEYKAWQDTQIQQMGQMRYQSFQQKHPDIKPNSREELQIATLLKRGYNEDDAYKVVMWDTKMQNVQSKAKTQVKQQIQAKKQANVESASVPPQSLPKSKTSFEEELGKKLDEEWDGTF